MCVPLGFVEVLLWCLLVSRVLYYDSTFLRNRSPKFRPVSLCKHTTTTPHIFYVAEGQCHTLSTLYMGQLLDYDTQQRTIHGLRTHLSQGDLYTLNDTNCYDVG